MSVTITGSVFDTDMSILANANVKEINLAGATIAGVKTDKNGKFAIVVASKDSWLQFSFVGYQTETIQAKDFGSYIELTTDVESLDDAVVVGGTKKDTGDNTGLYVIMAILGLTTVYFAFKKEKPNTPTPKKVKV